ncbi:unnamed protein product [Linum tenue]|uniref:Uncharacterized protein n=1 Tax=Linum tenue TaxID=586396 RepID=A0AAV0KTY4_9ROSI|nr:unnamed protein product [Linum tenue]
MLFIIHMSKPVRRQRRLPKEIGFSWLCNQPRETPEKTIRGYIWIPTMVRGANHIPQI